MDKEHKEESTQDVLNRLQADYTEKVKLLEKAKHDLDKAKDTLIQLQSDVYFSHLRWSSAKESVLVELVNKNQKEHNNQSSDSNSGHSQLSKKTRQQKDDA